MHGAQAARLHETLFQLLARKGHELALAFQQLCLNYINSAHADGQSYFRLHFFCSSLFVFFE